jgi:hypothetical protein
MPAREIVARAIVEPDIDWPRQTSCELWGGKADT